MPLSSAATCFSKTSHLMPASLLALSDFDFDPGFRPPERRDPWVHSETEPESGHSVSWAATALMGLGSRSPYAIVFDGRLIDRRGKIRMGLNGAADSCAPLVVLTIIAAAPPP